MSIEKILAVKSDVFNCTYMTQNDINSKFVEFVNEAYATENAAVDRINTRIEETPFPELQQRLKQHLQETINQQNRLSQIIFKLEGEPTDAKAHLPELKPPMGMMLKKTIKDTVKTITDDKKENPLPEELELLRIKQDIGIEGSEIVSYKTLIEMAQKMPGLDTALFVPLLKHNLDEEISMQKWCMDNLPMVMDKLLPNIISAINK
jgi:ferritin-like metal-binding protein YciE